MCLLTKVSIYQVYKNAGSVALSVVQHGYPRWRPCCSIADSEVIPY